MGFELLIALRYLFTAGGKAFISVISWIAVFGVTLGVAALIIVMGVMNGFTTDLQEKLIGMTSHVIISNAGGHTRENPEELERIARVPGVTGATPFIYTELMISSPTGAKGVVLQGIDPKTAPSVLGALAKLKVGTLDDLDGEGLPGIVVGQALARLLNVSVGSRVHLLAPQGQQTAAGFNPRIRSFRVAGIFALGLYEHDSSRAFVSLPAARDLLGWPPDMISGLELSVNDMYRANEIADLVLDAIRPSMHYAQTWMTMHGNLFAALKLEKAAMAVILVLVILVGSFPIVTALVMLVMEKTRDIAILMSMGATNKAIRRIFIIQGLVIGCMGTALGSGLGVLICFLLKRYQFIELPKGVYSLDYLPVLLRPSEIALTALAALVLCFLATLYPAYQAARLEPVDALRHE